MLDVRGPDGAEPSIDTARVGPREPARALVISSGTHGAEGSYGSAVQRHLLGQQLDVTSLPANTALVLRDTSTHARSGASRSRA